VFGEDRINVFVTLTPFVWLPAVMPAALLGHIVVFRPLTATPTIRAAARDGGRSRAVSAASPR